MTNIVLPVFGIVANLGPGITNYAALGSTNGGSKGVEAQIQTTWRTAGTFSNMYTRVSLNTLTASSTLTYRVGAGNGNQSITIGAGTTGELTDAIHTDTVSAGNQVNYQLISGGTGTAITLRSATMQFAPTTTSNTVNREGNNGTLTDTSVNTTYYNNISGALGTNTTEASAQFKNKTAATLQNLYVYVSVNTTSVATVKSRVNGADGNLAVSITSGTTGVFEDTTHTDSVVSGDLINTAVNSTVTTTFTITNIAVEYLTTSNITMYQNGQASGTSLAAAGTQYYGISGNPGGNNTESNMQIPTGIALSATNFEVYVVANTTTATSTARFRLNAGNGNQSVTFGSGVTGYAEDTTHTDAVSTSQEINYQGVAGATGTSILWGYMGFLADYTTAGGTVPFRVWMNDY